MATGKRQMPEEITFVLLGVLGSGKSSTGNSILGRKDFKIGAGTIPVTKNCQESLVFRFGKKVTVIDTPGLTNATSLLHIKRELEKLQGRPHHGTVIYVLTIKIGRYTGDEKAILEELFKKYKSYFKNCIIIFTNRDELLDEDDPADQIVDSWIKKNPSLQKLIKENKLLFFAFQNKGLMEEENTNQVKDLMSGVDGLEGEEESYCPVSVKTNKKISVGRDWFEKNFGECGKLKFDQEYALQNK